MSLSQGNCSHTHTHHSEPLHVSNAQVLLSLCIACRLTDNELKAGLLRIVAAEFLTQMSCTSCLFSHRHTDNEPKAGLLRIVAAGGRASEPREPGPGGVGAVAVGTRTLSEGGAVGDWSREQVGLLFCMDVG
jgi:hypothetical protein